MDLVLRALVAYLLIFLVTRVVGRRELDSAQPFDLILLVVIGDLVQQGITQNDESLTGLALVVTTLALLVVGTSYLDFRVPALKPVLQGEPIVLVEDGRLIERNARRERLSRDDIMSEAREQQIASLDDVRWAVLETTGRISFISK